MTQADVLTATDAELHEAVYDTLFSFFPVVRKHGGEDIIDTIDRETGDVEITIIEEGYGCRMSVTTVQAIERILPKELDFVTTVTITVDIQEENESHTGCSDC